MDPTTFGIAQGAAGSAGTDPVYVDDVFSNYVYTGTGSGNSPQSINLGIDMSTEGGLTWIKYRDGSFGTGHYLYDTERTNASLSTNVDYAQNTNDNRLDFTSTGFNVKNDGGDALNASGYDYASWTFRKSPGFFDVVTYPGTGSVQNISHNLGSMPGFIIIKRYSNTEDWTCYHRSLGAGKYIQLNGSGGEQTLSAIFNDTEPTSSVFTVGTHDRVNTNGENYIAYLFAHDDHQFGTNDDESIIHCGNFTSDGVGYNFENIGFEPQWLMIKQTSGAGGSWYMIDNMRGFPMRGLTADTYVRALRGESTSGDINYPYVFTTTTGFEYDESSIGSHSFVYIAIRRPNKPITDPTKLFQSKTYSGTGATDYQSTLFPVDMLHTHRTNGGTPYIMSRMQGPQRYFGMNGTSMEGSGAGVIDFGNDYLKLDNSGAGSGTSDSYIHLYFRRAPGFFDVVPYIGNGSSRTIAHRLGTTPSIVILKNRNNTYNTYLQHYQAGVSNTSNWFELSSSSIMQNSTAVFNGTLPTSTVFSVGNGDAVNKVDAYCCAYLFADMPGVSKAGTYNGDGSNLAVEINCGFTNGARFVLIKRTDATGGWYYFDYTRGINTGDDPYMLINNPASQNTGDYIDPLNSGFTVAPGASPDANPLNVSGGTYIYLAIA